MQIILEKEPCIRKIYNHCKKEMTSICWMNSIKTKFLGNNISTFFMFFICNALALVVNVLELLGFNDTYLFQILGTFSNSLVIINSSVNILVYCTFGKKFRTVFMQIFFGKQPPCTIITSRSVAHSHATTTTQAINLSNTIYSSSLNTTNGETVPLTAGFCNSNNLRQGRIIFEE